MSMVSCNAARISILVVAFMMVGCGTSEPESGGVCTDSSPRAGYPEGPYGTRIGDVLVDVTFKDSTDGDVSLSSLHQDGAARLLLISTGAGWCTACIEEQPQLQEWSQLYKDKGLRVIMTLFEDALGAPADGELASKWKSDHELTFPVLVDDTAFFSAYYDSSLAPMNMIVDACTMTIVEIIIGSKPSEIQAELVRNLQ